MIYITGDTHADAKRLSSSSLKGLKRDDTLIICGDFGFIWDDSPEEKKILKELGSRDYDICFIDGAHENFALLDKYEASIWKKGKVHHICGRLYHLMRGQVFHIENKKIFCMGGGESPDAEIREESGSLTGREIPSQAELLEGAKNIEAAGFELDYIIAHEPPSRTKGFLHLDNSEPLAITTLNTYFDEIVKHCKFQKLYFGSMHKDKLISPTQTAIFKCIREAESGKELG